MLCAIATALALAACQPNAKLPRPAAPKTTVATTETAHAGIASNQRLPFSVFKPTWQMPSEKKVPGKADVADDFRFGNKQWYAQTEPPKTKDFRAMKEWEGMESVWTVYSDYMPNDKPVRRMMAQMMIAFVTDSKPQAEGYIMYEGEAAKEDFTNALKEFGATCEAMTHLHFVMIPNDAIWHIDSGPLPIVSKDGTLGFVDFAYYHERYLDDAQPSREATDFYKDLTTFRLPMNYEGGNYQGNGAGGVCLTSERQLQNTGWSLKKTHHTLEQYTNCKNLTILKDITDDGTGHIDMFFKWADENRFLVSEYDSNAPEAKDPGYSKTFHENQKRMDDNVDILKAIALPGDATAVVIRQPMMTRLKDEYGNLPRSFINSTIINKVDVYPTFSTKACQDPAGAACKDTTDCNAPGADFTSTCVAGKCTKTVGAFGCDALMGCASGQVCVEEPYYKELAAKAHQSWIDVAPDVKHVGVDATRIAFYSGAVHCITRTIPKANHAKWIADGACAGQVCTGSAEGYAGACECDGQCTGAKYVCNCQFCKGKCASNGKGCGTDGDCLDKAGNVIAGDCVIDPKQTCPGVGESSSLPCGDVSFEGKCEGATLSFCEGGKLNTQSCGGCCGWSVSSAYYDCLSGGLCTGCNDACGAESETGCSEQSTHAWKCVKDAAGCLVREWSFCGPKGKCDAATHACGAATDTPDAGSTGGGPCSVDAGPADAGSTDAGTCVDPDVAVTQPDQSTPDSATGTDAKVPTPDDLAVASDTTGGTGGDGATTADALAATDSGTPTTGSGGGDSGGCAVAASARSDAGLALAFGFALAVLALRRRRGA